MSQDDKELAQWRAEWQGLGGQAQLAEELAVRVAKDGARLRRHVALEIGAVAFSTTLSVWLMARTHGELSTVAICAAILVFNGVWVTRLWTLRDGSLRAIASGLDAFVELTRRRLDDDRRWNEFAVRSLQVLTAMVIPWGVWTFFARQAVYRAEPWRAIVGFGTAAAILLAAGVTLVRKRRKLRAERERFESMVADGTLE